MEMELCLGDRMLMHGLTEMSGLNGHEVIMGRYDADSGRWTVVRYDV